MNLPYLEEFEITKLYSPKHFGLDLVGISKEVRAVQPGKVYLSAYDSKTWGNCIVVQQNDGYFAIYGHLKNRYKMAGQAVQGGEWIGNEGKTGNTTIPHLYLEIRKNFEDSASSVNPINYLGLINQKGVAKLVKEQTSKWAKEAQAWVKNNQISDGEHPKNAITREEIWVLLFRLANCLKQEAQEISQVKNCIADNLKDKCQKKRM